MNKKKFVGFILNICMFLLIQSILNGNITYNISNNTLDENINTLRKKAFESYKQNDYQKSLLLLESIPNLEVKTNAWILYVKVLFKSKNYKRLIDVVCSTSIRKREAVISEYIYFFTLSCLYEDQIESLQEFIGSHNKILRRGNNQVYKTIFVTLFQNRNYDQIIQLIELLPNKIFSEKQKKLIAGVALFYQGKYEESKPLLKQSISNNDHLMKMISLDYLSLICVSETGLLKEITFDETYDQTKINLVIILLKLKEYNEAENLIIEIDNTQIRNLFYALIEVLKNKNYKNADYHLSNIDNNFFKKNLVFSLMDAEIDYHLKKFEQATIKYKLYKKLNREAQNYANHAIGFSYYGYYKYNNSAYYWLKNISQEPSVYDSLALNNLAELYTFTKHYNTALPYYSSYLRRYDSKSNNKFISTYLNILLHLNEFEELEHAFNKYLKRLDKKDVFNISSSLADNYYDKKSYDEAKKYYLIAEEFQRSDQTEFRMNKIRFFEGDFPNYEAFIIDFIKNNKENIKTKSLSFDLINYYFEQEKYDEILLLTDSLSVYPFTESAKDSLLYFKAFAYDKLKKWDESSDIFLEFCETYQDSSYIKQIYNKFEESVLNLPLEKALEKVEVLTDTLYSDFLNNSAFFTLAKIYENANQYNAANDLYEILLENNYEDALSIYFKLGINSFYNHDYERIIKIADDVMFINTEYEADIKYLKFLAASALKKEDIVIQTLLEYYFNFPSKDYYKNILLSLSEYYNEKKQFLYAWYFLDQYNDLSSATEKIQIADDLNQLRFLLKEDSLVVKQIIDFDQLFLQSEQFMQNLEQSKGVE